MARRNHRAEVARLTQDAMDESARSRSPAGRLWPSPAMLKREAARKKRSMKDPSIVAEPRVLHAGRGHVSPLGGVAKRSK
jgi:hypothetical protein